MVSQRPKSLSISDGEQNRSRGGNMQGVTSIFFPRSLDICKNGVPHNHHELTSAHHVMFLLLTHGGYFYVPVFACRILIRNNFTFCNVEFDNEFLNQMSKLEFFLVSLQHYLIIFLITFNPRTVSGLRHMV